jgi:hypothetical protein
MNAQPAVGPHRYAWERPSSDPELMEGAVHVWRADLAKVDDELTRLLSPAELARAERFARGAAAF